MEELSADLTNGIGEVSAGMSQINTDISRISDRAVENKDSVVALVQALSRGFREPVAFVGFCAVLYRKNHGYRDTANLWRRFLQVLERFLQVLERLLQVLERLLQVLERLLQVLERLLQ
ncbi:MAG: hypothetical protein LBD58_08900, partial [Treponema sp.]|nr:hypothetical protein [Treponema sp.]